MRHLLPILVTSILLYSCNDSDRNTEVGKYNDSIKIERYFEQQESIQYIKEYDYQTKILVDNEKNRDTALIHHFIHIYFDSIKKTEGFNYQPDNLIDYIHSIDINNDGALDIIYEGPSGGEATLTEMYIQYQKGFKKIFTGYQNITEMNFSNGKLSSFNIINPGCCADPQVVEYHYIVLFDSLKTEILLNKTFGYLSRTELVKNKFSRPKPITIKNNAKLRSEAIVFEGIEHPVWGSEGNIIGYYTEGSKGIALGNKKDSTGTWLYVLMSSDSKPDKCSFPTFLEQPTSIYGWIKEEDIK